MEYEKEWVASWNAHYRKEAYAGWDRINTRICRGVAEGGYSGSFSWRAREALERNLTFTLCDILISPLLSIVVVFCVILLLVYNHLQHEYRHRAYAEEQQRSGSSLHGK